MWQNNYDREGQIFILVFSVIDKQSFEEIKKFRERIRHKDKVNDYPVIAVGNKCDLRMEPDFDIDKGVNMDEVLEWCTTHRVPYIETSVVKGKNINFLFRQAVYEYLMYQREIIMKSD